jgi:hypothetical protein
MRDVAHRRWQPDYSSEFNHFCDYRRILSVIALTLVGTVTMRCKRKLDTFVVHH